MLTSTPRQITNQTTVTQIIIASGQTTSAAVSLQSQCTPITLFLPSNFIGTTIQVLVQTPAGDYVTLTDPATGDAVVITVSSVPCAMGILPADFLSVWQSFKLVSSDAQSAQCVCYITGRAFA